MSFELIDEEGEGRKKGEGWKRGGEGKQICLWKAWKGLVPRYTSNTLTLCENYNV